MENSDKTNANNDYCLHYEYIDNYDVNCLHDKYGYSKSYEGGAYSVSNTEDDLKKAEARFLEKFKLKVGFKAVNIKIIDNDYKEVKNYVFKNPYYINLKKCSQDQLKAIWDKEREIDIDEYIKYNQLEELSVQDLKKGFLDKKIDKNTLLKTIIDKSREG